MRFLIVGDLHGNIPRLHFKEFDAIIAPGDFCSDAAKKYMFQAVKERIDDPKAARPWYDIAGRARSKAMVKKSLRDGRRILERLDKIGVPVYIVPGNWDWAGEGKGWVYVNKNYFPTLTRGLRNVIDAYHRRIDACECEIIGTGIHSGPEYPQTKDELKRFTPARLRKMKHEHDRERKHLAGLFRKAKKPVVFISHNVPYNTKLDRINSPASPRNGQHFGSVLARELVKEFCPVVCIGGHMHEHFASQRLGKTVCINAGHGPDVNVLLELDGNKIKRLEFYDGKKQHATREGVKRKA
jgi:Icc-related predicted phosphoesterase